MEHGTTEMTPREGPDWRGVIHADAGSLGGWQEPGEERVSHLPHKPLFPDLQDRHRNSPPWWDGPRYGKGLVSHLVSTLPPSPLDGQSRRSPRQDKDGSYRAFSSTRGTQGTTASDMCCRNLAPNRVHSDPVNPALREGLMWEQQTPPLS